MRRLRTLSSALLSPALLVSLPLSLPLGALSLVAGCDSSPAGTVDASANPDMAAVPHDLAAPPDLVPPPMPHGDFYNFAISKITLPMSKNDFGFDVNGDGKLDNQLGTIVSVLSASNLDVQLGVDQAIELGTSNVLISVQSQDTTLTTDSIVGVSYYLGQPFPSPLWNTDDAGNIIPDGGCHACPDFSGSGSFNVDKTVTPGLLIGALTKSHLSTESPVTTTRPVTLDVRLQLFPNVAPVDLIVNGAHAEFDTATDPVSKKLVLHNGRLQGSVKSTDIAKNVLPAVAKVMTLQLADNPNSPSSMQIIKTFDLGGCSDPDGTAAKKYDSVINLCEITQSPLIQAVVTPDVQVYDANGNYAPNAKNQAPDSLSVGIAFEAVSGTFTRP